MTEHCKAVENGKRCKSPANTSGAARGLCVTHYRRVIRTGLLTRDRAQLGPGSVQVVFKLTSDHHVRMVELAERTGRSLSDVLREAVAAFLGDGPQP